MTKEQKEKALAFLKNMQECTYDGVEEIRTAIKCLEQPTSDDCVSRQAVLDKKVLIELPDGQSFYCIDPKDVESLPPVTPTFPKGVTNGDMIEKFFGKDIYCTLIRMMYSSCCEKLKRWWNAPYKRGGENGSN